jgi:hypothetical protein
MNTKNIIQASANVIRITSVKVGDIYKRFDDQYDYTYFGIVKNVWNDGVSAIIESVEYRYSYSSIDVQYKILKGTKDYTIFPATLEDLQNEFAGCIAKKEKEIEEYKEKIITNEKLIIETQKLLSGEMQKELNPMAYKTLTQGEFDEQVKQLN